MSAYTGKSLHVAIQAGEIQPYAVFTNDGDYPIARCVDRATAHLLAAAPDLLEALRAVADFWAGGDAPDELTRQINAALSKAAAP
jgi:hypothetical protein